MANIVRMIKRKKELTLSENKKIAGVCAGIAEYFDIDPTIVRIGAVILALITGFFPAIAAYIIAALVIPAQGE